MASSSCLSLPPPRQGLVTLVFTRLHDVDALWSRLGDAMRGLLAEHDAVLRGLLGRDGYEAKREATGFLFAFCDAAAALRAAAAAQEALLSVGRATDRADGHAVPLLRVGMGVHTGPVVARDDAMRGRVDYLGPTANLAARLAQATVGDQILLTGDTLRAAREAGYSVEAPEEEGAWLAPRGTHRLRGFQSATQLLELRPRRQRHLPMLPVTTAQALCAVGTPSDLPRVETPMFGRDALLLSVVARVDAGERWLTLVGLPGAGKSRLALELARWCLGGDEGRVFPGGAWWVPLEGIGTLPEVLGAIARTLRLALFDADAEGQLSRALSARGELLIVLDEAEHLVDLLHDLVPRLLHGTPGLFLVVTSRVPVGGARERVVEVPPLPCPAATATLADLAKNPGVLLLVDHLRRRGMTSDRLDAARLRGLGALARRLDGLPAALELALAGPPGRAAVEALEAALAWTEGARTGLAPTEEGARLLRGSLGRSWELLPSWGRAALTQLAAFQGGFTLEAAEAVLDLGAWPDAPPVLDVLELLLEHHLALRVARPDAQGGPQVALPALAQAFGLEAASSP